LFVVRVVDSTNTSTSTSTIGVVVYQAMILECVKGGASGSLQVFVSTMMRCAVINNSSNTTAAAWMREVKSNTSTCYTTSTMRMCCWSVTRCERASETA